MKRVGNFYTSFSVVYYSDGMPNPAITEKEATGLIKLKYEEIKRAFVSPVVPVFFTFIAPYEEYFVYVADQIVRIVQDPRFRNLAHEIGENIQSVINTTLPPSVEYREWVSKYANSPGFYNFTKDNEHIFRMNVSLAFVFISLREAVKGWAVAAKKLPGTGRSFDAASSPFRENETLYNEAMTGAELILSPTSLTSSSPKAVELNLLKDFLELCRSDFMQYMKTEEFLIMRVGLERLILLSIPLFPNPLFSPINETLKLIMKKKNFPDLLYLLSDEFPTLVMQRMIFSGYMLP